jgi:succinate dehydrogenase/fumarate reductase flavoprotein subunit
MTDVDVLVIGSGAAGLSAALAAKQGAAARVLVAEG